MKIKGRGFAHERDLVLKFWKKGFAVVRAPASGSKVKRTVYPDVLAIRNGFVFVFEVKTTGRLRDVYLDSKQVAKVKEFSKRAGGLGFVAVKIVGTGEWRFVPIDKLQLTRGGRFKVCKLDVEKGLRLTDLVELTHKTRRLDEFL